MASGILLVFLGLREMYPVLFCEYLYINGLIRFANTQILFVVASIVYHMAMSSREFISFTQHVFLLFHENLIRTDPLTRVFSDDTRVSSDD